VRIDDDMGYYKRCWRGLEMASTAAYKWVRIPGKKNILFLVLVGLSINLGVAAATLSGN
jgi:hypothetical protein